MDIPCEGEDVGINWCFPVFAKTDTASLMFWDSNQFYTRFYVQNEFGVVKMDKDTIRLRDLILLSDIQIPPATSEEVSFYPNPVIDHLYFQDNVENISVYSVQGTLLLHLNSSTKQVDLTSLSSGMYILQYQIKGSIVPIRKQIIKK